MTITRRKVITSLIFKLLERFGTQGVQFIVSIILARILEPEAFGLVVILLIFTNIAQVFVHSGLNSALVQKKDVDDIDYSTVFFASMGIAVFAYSVLFIAAPFISLFYKMPDLTITLRVIAIILFFNCASSLQQTKAVKELRFKMLMAVSIVGALLSGLVGIVLAYTGFGVWALVFQQIVHGVVNSIGLLIAFRWTPRLVFSLRRFKTLFSFGWKLLCSLLLDTVYNNLSGLIIGKMFSSETLAFYDRGSKYPSHIITAINGTVQTVMLPVFSEYQDDKAHLKSKVRRSIIMSSFIIFPAMAGLAAIAKPLVHLMLTDNWLPSVPFLMISCFIYAFWPLATTNLNAITAQGRTDIFLKLEIIKKIYGLIVLAITSLCFNSALAIMIGIAATTPIGICVNALPNQKLLNYSVKEQLKDILPYFALSLMMFGLVWCFTLLNWNAWATLGVQIVTGVLVYSIGSWIFRLEGFVYLLNIAKEARKA